MLPHTHTPMQVIPSILSASDAAATGLLSSRADQLDMLAAVLAASDAEGAAEELADADDVGAASG